jgi:hypothetical protein
MFLVFFIATIMIFGPLLGAAIFQWLWNITMPEAFWLRGIRFWVAFRLLPIAAFLTSGGLIRLAFDLR